MHFLLHCSLKAAGYETLREQFEFIYKYIENLQQENKKQKEVIDKARECSYIYENSLGKTRLVNEDIFDEVNNVLQKYKEMVGVSDENNT